MTVCPLLVSICIFIGFTSSVGFRSSHDIAADQLERHAINATRGKRSRSGNSWTASCNGGAFDIVTGEINMGGTADTQRIADGLKEWVENIRDGIWGTWLQERLHTVEDMYRRGIRDARMALDGADENQDKTSPQVFEAWKLLKIVFLQYFPKLLIGDAKVTESIPQLIASFADGKLQSVGKIEYREEASEVYFPLAVTRYTISYEVKGTEKSQKGAGRALLAGWIEEHMVDLEDNLVVYTFPASAFVRNHYIKNGARNACAAPKRNTDEDCAAMSEEGKNCDCDVRLCVQLKCLYFFQAGMCDTASAWDMALGLKKGCYSFGANFVGSCSD